MKNFVKKASSKISKLSDEQVEAIFQRITNENEVLSSVVQSLSCGLLVVDRNYHVIKANAAASTCLPFNHKFNDPKRKDYPLWDLIEDEEISAFFMKLNKNRKTNAAEEFSFMVSERTEFVSISVMPIAEKKIKDYAFIITVDNITAKKQQEILFHRNESLAALTRLAASVAHDIKNPLGAISIHMQLLQKSIKKSRDGDGELPPESRLEDYINVVNEEIENLNKIVLDFLFATRPLQANLSLSSPEAILEKTISFFRPEFESKNICIKPTLSYPDLRLLIDDKLFRDVIVNLLQNALHAILKRFPLDSENTVNLLASGENSTDFEAEGENGESSDYNGLKGTLIIASMVKNQKYVLTVADNGCGIDEKSLRHVFEPYYTTKANGTGLGLTMVYKIIKEFRGDIAVNSVVDQGTVFTITIPLPQKETRLLSVNSDSTDEGGEA